MAKQYICPICHYIGKAKYKKHGSGKIELRAWLIFPFNLPYTIWRMMSKIQVCKSCGAEGLIDEDSPVGLRLMARLDKGTFSPRPYDRPQTATTKATSSTSKIHSKEQQF